MLSTKRLFNFSWRHSFRYVICKYVNTNQTTISNADLENLQASIEAEAKGEEIIPNFKKSLLYNNKIAIKDNIGEYSYTQLYRSSKKLAIQVSNICGSAASTNVAYICDNNVLSPLILWACWISGQVGMPLNVMYSEDLIKQMLQEARVKLIIASPEYEKKVQNLAEELGTAMLIIDHNFMHMKTDNVDRQIIKGDGRIIIAEILNNEFYTDANALLLYKIENISNPLGLLFTHRCIDSHIKSMLYEWKFTAADRLLYVPTCHQHMLSSICTTMCLLSVGGKVNMYSNLNTRELWSKILLTNASENERINVLIADPKHYKTLIIEYDKIFAHNIRMTDYIEHFCKKTFRLMVSISMPLSVKTFKRWRNITGHTLLGCFGMPEIGIAFNNPYAHENLSRRERRADAIGLPMPGIKVRLVNSENKVVMAYKGEMTTDFWMKKTLKATMRSPPIIGEMQISGPNVFKEYFKNANATRNSFVNNYFKTNNIGIYKDDVFMVQERANVDIIKRGIHKVCGIDIELLLLSHQKIKEVAVIGVPDKNFGEKICVICKPEGKAKINLKLIRDICKEKLPNYMLPTVLKLIDISPSFVIKYINRKELMNKYIIDDRNLKAPGQ